MNQSWQRSTTTVNGKTHGPEVDRDYGIQEHLHRTLIRDIDDVALRNVDQEHAREMVERAARLLVAELYPQLVGDDKEEIVSRVTDEVVGLGPAPAERAPHRGRVYVHNGRHDETIRLSGRDAAGRRNCTPRSRARRIQFSHRTASRRGHSISLPPACAYGPTPRSLHSIDGSGH